MYADAVVAAATADGPVALFWRDGAACIKHLGPRESPEDFLVIVTGSLTTHYPWRREGVDRPLQPDGDLTSSYRVLDDRVRPYYENRMAA